MMNVLNKTAGAMTAAMTIFMAGSALSTANAQATDSRIQTCEAPAGQSCPAALRDQPLRFNLVSLDRVRAERGRLRGTSQGAYERLIRVANGALNNPNRSVIDKGDKLLPRGASVNDYTSLARYWWPDPKKADGLPWIRRDGEANPALNSPQFDQAAMGKMRRDFFNLSVAHYLTRDQRYADKAEEIAMVWFVNEKTRMNPHFNYGQSIPGRTEGRPSGIIDARGFATVVDGAILLKRSGQLSPELEEGLKEWFGEFSYWLMNSEIGKKESQSRGNHGAYYDAQLSHFLIFTGRCDIAKRLVEDSKRRTGEQITARGFMPVELERTRSLHYSGFSVQAFAETSLLAERFGEDLYDHEVQGAGSVRDSIHLLSSYAGRFDEWPHPMFDGDTRGHRSVWVALVHALMVDPDDQRVRRAMAKFDDRDETNDLRLLAYDELYPR